MGVDGVLTTGEDGRCNGRDLLTPGCHFIRGHLLSQIHNECFK